MVIDIDDDDSQNLLRLFNTPEGHKYLKDVVGVEQETIDHLELLGISGIANLLCCIKFAKYYELTEKDVVATVATDSYVMYTSRVDELNAQQGPFDMLTAARDFSEHLHGIRTDSMKELSYEERKRIHNLKYYTWVEQQGKTFEEINQQWYDAHYWTDIHAQAADLDALINEFNARTGVLKNM
ncbi:hypothetical protein SDC9_125211 [bioreactor metagenome]|uniref:Pyridoxal-5-phosphate-dependent protein subunit beta n=1 Tax=bioreactor metagenome TaxID=1076179 RepID=A0A645CMB8_9ZZZZ